jgi:hypothetical protein
LDKLVAGNLRAIVDAPQAGNVLLLYLVPAFDQTERSGDDGMNTVGQSADAHLLTFLSNLRKRADALK